MNQPFHELYDFGEISPIVDELTTVEVSFTNDFHYLDVLCKSLASEYNFELSRSGSQIDVEKDDLINYFNMLLKIRIDLVLGNRVPKLNLCIPAAFSNLLTNVGIVSDPIQSVKLVPVAPDLELDVDFINRMSDLVFMLGRLGFVYSSEMIRRSTGSWEFMSSSLINGIVHTMDDAHPAYAVATAIMAQRGIESVIAPRVKYAPSVFIHAAIRTLTTPTGGGKEFA
jgi:hypothetical protein